MREVRREAQKTQLITVKITVPAVKITILAGKNTIPAGKTAIRVNIAIPVQKTAVKLVTQIVIPELARFDLFPAGTKNTSNNNTKKSRNTAPNQYSTTSI